MMISPEWSPPGMGPVYGTTWGGQLTWGAPQRHKLKWRSCKWTSHSPAVVHRAGYLPTTRRPHPLYKHPNRRVYRSVTAQDYHNLYKSEPLTGLRTVCFVFATDIGLLLAASKAADVHENSRVCSKYQIILLSDTGMTRTADIFICNKAHAHMPPSDPLRRWTRQETALCSF